jgi:hypothetical protein
MMTRMTIMQKMEVEYERCRWGQTASQIARNKEMWQNLYFGSLFHILQDSRNMWYERYYVKNDIWKKLWQKQILYLFTIRMKLICQTLCKITIRIININKIIIKVDRNKFIISILLYYYYYYSYVVTTALFW